MTQATWEKSAAQPAARSATKNKSRWQFTLITVVMFGAIAAMIISGTMNGGKYFITVNDLLARTDLHGKSVKISGAVIGSTIRFDADTKTIYFTIAHVPDSIAEIQSEGGLARVLHAAVSDPMMTQLAVQVHNQAVPDLLQNEAQAILTGRLDANGVFQADELQLKCPSKYESDLPKQQQAY